MTSAYLAFVAAALFAVGATHTAQSQPTGGNATPSSAGNSTSNTDTVGSAQVVGPTATVWLSAVPNAPTAAAPWPVAAGGRTFYVDSLVGDDSNDGLAAGPAASGLGPWRTLARVWRSDLRPGDALRLACGSEWSETLRLPASGTASRPIVVSGPPGGCTTRPVIDGSVALTAERWVRHKGDVFKATLDRRPLLVKSGADTWPAAHHPNRGHLAADPSSPYLALPTNGNSVTFNGRTVSTVLTTGSELALPADASLTAGARVRVRTYAWLMNESEIASVDGPRLTLAQPTSYPVQAGWGYLLLDQLWMADSAGEWFYDAAAKTLYAHMPGGAVPASPVRAAVLAVGVDLNDRAHVVVDGLAVRDVGMGGDLRGSRGVVLRNMSFEDVADNGIDATSSNQLTIESSAFARTGVDAISGWRDGVGTATAMTVRNNVIRDSGVLMRGEQVVSVPRRSYAAIYAGPSSTISGNVIVNAGYIGIRLQGNSRVENNLVFGACSVLDDCAGIYIWTSRDSIIRGNAVIRSRGALAGKPANERHTAAQGIYLDEHCERITVENNTVIDADHGIQVHVSSANALRGNRLYANRRSQIWMQATANRDNPAGDVFDNLVTDNLIAATAPGSTGALLETAFASIAGFGTFERNRYFDRNSPIVVSEVSTSRRRNYTFVQWQGAAPAGLPAGRDAAGSAASGTPFATHTVAGLNLIANAALATNSAGWSSWNQTAPLGQLTREACPAGVCLRYIAGASVGLVSTPNFSVQAGQWYRLSIDLATGQNAQPVQLAVRRGGGGTNGYESLIDRAVTVSADRTWRRYSQVLLATRGVIAGNPATGDLGARLDIEGLLPGQTVRLANAELVPVTPHATAQFSGAFVNVGETAQQWACPMAGDHIALCANLRNLANGSPVEWPLVVPGYGSVIVYAQPSALADSDRDGIADAQDRCPGTPAGEAVNAAGCALVLR